MVHRDERAFDAIKKIAFSSLRSPHKYMAIQALHLIDSQRAASVFLDILKKAPGVRFKESPSNKLVELGHRSNAAALIGHISSEVGETNVVPHLIAILESIIKHDAKWWEPHAAIIRSLGKLGDHGAAPAIRPFLDRNVDVAARAVQALGRLQDTESIPRIRKLFLNSDYKVLIEKAAISLGQLGDESVAPELREMLDHPDENLRGAAAKALERMGKM
jgi:HEAT repeat protein